MIQDNICPEATQAFNNYACKFDLSNERIRLKLDHMKRVASIVNFLTKKMHLPADLRKLAYICGLFHDIGRFEQVKRYGTFFDANSVNHALLSVDVIYQERILSFLSESNLDLITAAIANHNRIEIDRTVTDNQTLLICKLIRDADKCDIFRVFSHTDPFDSMGFTLENLQSSWVSNEVCNRFFQHSPIEASARKTPLDVLVMSLAFFFDMNYIESLKLAHRAGDYRYMLDTLAFSNESTRQQISSILNDLETYLETREAVHDAK